MTNSQFLIRCLAVITLSLTLVACGPMSFVVNVAPTEQELDVTVVEPGEGWRPARVAIIDVTGTIHNSSNSGLLARYENPVALLHEQLNKAASDPRVRGVILRINSPGGTVTASDIMYRLINNFRAESGKPVIALMMDVAASGGYYIACAGDEIVAHPTTLTGSVGVILQTFSIKPALNRLGVQTEAIVSGPNKAIASPLGTLSDEHRTILQGLVNEYYGEFVSVVRKGRPNIDDSTFASLTDGRIMSGKAAAQVGMVDHVGDLDTAAARVRDLAGIARSELVMYHRPTRYVGSPYATQSGPARAGATSGGGGTQINVAQINLDGDGLVGFADCSVGIYYLWQPNLP